MTALLAVLAAYLLGSLSFSYLIVRLLRGIDIRTVGSGNAGATNVLRIAGMVPAAFALVLDAGKGLAAVLVARALDVGPAVVGAVAVAAVLGHMFPVFFGFRGGKGVATAAGTLGSLAPWATLLALTLFLVVVGVTRYVSLGSIVVAVFHPLSMLLVGRLGLGAGMPAAELVAASAVIALLVVLKHRANLVRLIKGREKRLGDRVDEPGPAA